MFDLIIYIYIVNSRIKRKSYRFFMHLKQHCNEVIWGSGGLGFYKLFIRDWISKLKVGGKISVEVGFNQAESVANLFYKCNMLENIKTVKDINNIERVVSAQKSIFKTLKK